MNSSFKFGTINEIIAEFEFTDCFLMAILLHRQETLWDFSFLDSEDQGLITFFVLKTIFGIIVSFFYFFKRQYGSGPFFLTISEQ